MIYKKIIYIHIYTCIISLGFLGPSNVSAKNILSKNKSSTNAKFLYKSSGNFGIFIRKGNLQYYFNIAGRGLVGKVFAEFPQALSFAYEYQRLSLAGTVLFLTSLGSFLTVLAVGAIIPNSIYLLNSVGGLIGVNFVGLGFLLGSGILLSAGLILFFLAMNYLNKAIHTYNYSYINSILGKGSNNKFININKFYF